MMTNLKVTATLFVILLLVSGASALDVNFPEKGITTTGTKDTLQVIKQPYLPKTKLHRTTTGDESEYYIDIKEERSYNNFFTRHFLSGYKDKDLRRVLMDFGERRLSGPFRSTYVLVVEKAFRFPFVIFFIAIILGLIINVFLVIVILFITNLTMNLRAQKRKNVRDHFEKILTDLMLQVIDTREALLKLSNPKLKLNRNKNLLIEILMDYQKCFRGDSDRQITELYQEMDLGRVSYNKTFAVSFYQQVIGLRELANLQPYHAVEMIAEHLNDSNDIVRAEAQICYPYVNQEDPFEFLSVLEKPFSMWAQLNIYYYIKLHEMPVPSFDIWLNSPQPNVVNFCIRMIALFQQQENSDEIIRLLETPDESARNEAIKACGELLLFESKDVLKKSFQNETLKNQLEITRLFKNIGTEDDLPFLENIVRRDVTSLRLEACKTVYTMGESAISWLDELDRSMNFILTPYIAHIKDSRN